MKALIVYDSAFGNTEQIAKQIQEALPGSEISRPALIGTESLRTYDLVLVGSPTQGGKPLPSIRQFLDAIPSDGLRDVHVAAFDTRAEPGNFFLRWGLGLVGFAAGRIAGELRAKGGQLVERPCGFIVEGTEGPLRQGELERASAWARRLAEAGVQRAGV